MCTCLSPFSIFKSFIDEGMMSCECLNNTVVEMQYIDLQGDENHEIKSRIQILLVTANEIEYYAVIASLKPLDGYFCLVKYHHVMSNITGKNALYIFGKFGYFDAAVHKMPQQGPAAAQDVVTVAANCFGHSLNAIFAVGVACGVEKKAEMLDVLVSEKISVYTAARISTKDDDDDDDDDSEYKIVNRGESNMQVSSFLQTYFDQPPKWPTKSSKIASNLAKKPTLRKGNILSGNYLIDNKKFKKRLLKEFAYNAIGIEMEGAGLFHGHADSKYKIMIVKGVCDFGDGKKNKRYQPTAAMLAVDCLMHYISSPQSPQKFRESCTDNGTYVCMYINVCVFVLVCMCVHAPVCICVFVSVCVSVYVNRGIRTGGAMGLKSISYKGEWVYYMYSTAQLRMPSFLHVCTYLHGTTT